MWDSSTPSSSINAGFLQLIAGIKYLHSLGIVHRDLRLDNLLFTPDGTCLVICDFEGRWGNRDAPEVSRRPILDAGWTEKSDIYDLGNVIKNTVYGNVPITKVVE
jgi:serine/threonine protein kinase